MNRPTLFLLGVCAGLVVSLRAAEPPPTTRVTVSLYMWSESRAVDLETQKAVEETVFHYPVGKKTEKIAFTPGVRTPAFVYEGPLPLTFFKEEIGADNQPVRTPLAIADIPPDWNRALLLVAPAPGGSATPYQLIPMRDDRENLPLNHAKLVNLGQQDLVVQANGAVSTLGPGRDLVIGYANAQSIGLNIKLAATVNDQPRLVATTLVSARPGTRKTLLAYPQGSIWRILELADTGDKSPRDPKPVTP